MKNQFFSKKSLTVMSLMLAMATFTACGGDEAEGEVVPSTAPVVEAPVDSATPEGGETAPEATSTHTINDVIFLGDSTTYGLKAYEMLEGGTDTEQVWTPSSGTLTLSNQSIATIVYPPTGEEITIREAVEAAKPTVMVITLGVNGVSFLTEDGFKSEYTMLVNDIAEISPDTRIILNSMYPVESDYEYLADINNDKITTANGWIQAVAAETGLQYVDTYSLLLGSDGFLDESLGNGDGIHLGTAGFEIVVANIESALISG